MPRGDLENRNFYLPSTVITDKAKKKKDLLLAIGAAVCAALSNALMATLTKIEVGQGSQPAMILFWRSVWSFLFLFPIIFLSRPKFTLVSKVKTSRFKLHLIRSVAGFAGVLLYFVALKYLSLTVATLLYFTIPLFMPFVGYVWVRRPLPRLGWIGLIVGFIGVLFVIKPGHALFHTASLVGLLSGLIITIGQFAAHLLTTTESNNRINFYYFIVTGLITLPFTFFLPGKEWGALSLENLAYFFGIAVFGFGYLFALNFSLKHGSPSLVTSFLYTVVIFSMLLDWLIWHQIAHWMTWTGSVLVVVGVILIYHFYKIDHPND